MLMMIPAHVRRKFLCMCNKISFHLSRKGVLKREREERETILSKVVDFAIF